MKLSYFQLEPHIKKKISPLYLLSGEDPFLKQEAKEMIQVQAKHHGFNERIRFIPETAADWENLYAHLHASSLFSEKRLLELDFRHALPNKMAGQLLKEFGEKETPNLLLLIDIGKVNDTLAKSAWFKTLEQKGVLITIWPILREQLPQWIRERAKKYHLTWSLDAAHLLTDYVEGNLAAAHSAILKVALLNPQKPVDESLITALLTDENRFTIFDLVENMIALNQARMLHILENLKRDHTEPALILWAIARELRTLAEWAKQIKQGLSYPDLFQKYRIFARRQVPIRKFLTRYLAEDCWHSFIHLAHLDAIIKGASPGIFWDQLQIFCLRWEE